MLLFLHKPLKVWVNVLRTFEKAPNSNSLRENVGAFIGPYLPVFGLSKVIYSLNLCIQSKHGKIQTRKYSIFGHFFLIPQLFANFLKSLKSKHTRKSNSFCYFFMLKLVNRDLRYCIKLFLTSFLCQYWWL